MAAAPTLPSVSVEEYLKTDYEPNCEYLDGVLAPKPLPDQIHSRLQLLLGAYLLSQETEIHSRRRYRSSPAGKSDEVARPRCGRAVCSAARRTLSRPPDTALFTIEIASLDEPWQVLRGKVTDHLATGVSTVVIADPYNKTVLVADQGTPLHELTHPLIIEIPVPGAGVLKIDFDDFYAKL